jgi:hypothetical protein
LDEYITSSIFGKNVFIAYIYRSMHYNDWRTTCGAKIVRHIQYGPKWANAVTVIEK